MRLSALMVVKDEEPIVADALLSVAEFDEIVVVDTGSTDRTIEIARRFTDLVFTDFVWRDDFAAARNHAIDKATGDWCYSIDADHVLLTHVDKVRAEAARAELAGQRGALVRSLAAASGAYHWREVLFKRDPSIRWVGAVHECLNVATSYRADVERRCGYSKNHHADPDRNIRILLTGDLTRPRTQFYLGRECYERKRYDDAIRCMGEFLKRGKWVPEVAEAHLTIARSLWFLKRGDEARRACLDAIRVNPDFKEALLLMAGMHFPPRREKWARLAAAATNQDVLFVRA
jgi:glycosyltransferase involved in cell wall biosynthesis